MKVTLTFVGDLDAETQRQYMDGSAVEPPEKTLAREAIAAWAYEDLLGPEGAELVAASDHSVSWKRIPDIAGSLSLASSYEELSPRREELLAMLAQWDKERTDDDLFNLLASLIRRVNRGGRSEP